PMQAERLQRLARDHPRADRGRERLGLEWAKRHIFPLLDVARAPVVEHDEAKDHRFGLRLVKHLAHGRGLADHDAYFELEVEPPARAETGAIRIRRLQLAAR